MLLELLLDDNRISGSQNSNISDRNINQNLFDEQPMSLVHEQTLAEQNMSLQIHTSPIDQPRRSLVDLEIMADITAELEQSK